MSTSSQAAAMAAFSGLTNKSRSEVIHEKRKTPFVIPTLKEPTKTSATGLKRVPKLNTSLAATMKSSDHRSAGQKTPHTADLLAPIYHHHSLRDGRVTQQSDKNGSSSLDAVTAAAISALSRSTSTATEDQPDGPSFRPAAKPLIQTLKKSTSNHLNISLHSNATMNTTTTTLNLPKPADMIASVKNSIGSKMVHNNETTAMQQANAKVEEVRQSINSKAAARSHQRNAGKYDETLDKNNTLNDFRDAVDLRRICTPIFKAPSSVYDRIDLNHSVYDRQDQNNSCSTFGSSMLETDVMLIPQTPTIVVDLLDKPELPVVGLLPSSGHVNLSNNANASANANSKTKLSSNDNLNTSNDNILIESRTVRRKPPPPDDLHVTESHISDLGDSFALLQPASSSVVDNYADGQPINAPGEDDKVVKFPRFPVMPEYHSRKSSDHFPAIFKTSKLKMKGADPSVSISELSKTPSDGDEPTEVTKNDQGIVRRQSKVQLKTTMRKTKKREIKKQFNENKPWKNHSDLSYISDQERKRYEGLWASNKGLYMNNVVSMLAGVQYDEKSTFVGGNKKEEEEEDAGAGAGAGAGGEKVVEQDEDRDADGDGQLEKTEETEALKAALLSAKNVNGVDIANIHNLQTAEINLLIHGVVVKRIWQRSRLPDATLKEIWDLVDFRKDSTLNKEEFLVGMWLIDQCLYGRKLPKTVSRETWSSIISNGLNVVIKRKGRK